MPKDKSYFKGSKASRMEREEKHRRQANRKDIAKFKGGK
jgi:hypothetical protein